MTEKLLQAIEKGEIWLHDFNRCDYEKSFAAYCKAYAPLYTAASAQCAPKALAQELLEALAARQQRVLRWKRKVKRTNDQLMATFYLTPMLLQCEEASCKLLAQELCRQWSERWPADAYRLADYESIAAGFRNTVMGFAIGERKRGE